jgi:hypothetical protein
MIVCPCKKKKLFIPNSIERVREFFIFCSNLEKHPFIIAHKNGGTLNLNIIENGKFKLTFNFDEYHLESLLTRVRQFLAKNELFYFKDLKKDVIKVFGDDKEFEKFYIELVNKINKNFTDQRDKIEINGKNLIEKNNFTQLMKYRLYTGAIHSSERISSPPDSVQKGLVNDQCLASKYLTIFLASKINIIVQHIFNFRLRILEIAKDKDKINLFSELSNFSDRKL